MNGMSILVTGGAGFIGSYMVDRLVTEGACVTVFDNFHSGKKENLSQSINEIRLIKGDIRNRNFVANVVRECNPAIVFHLAASASVPDSVLHPEYNFETNVVGTFNLLHAMIKKPPRKFVFASSAAVYGSSNQILKEGNSLIPVSPYGTSKQCGEALCLSFERTFRIPLAIGRIFNVYGPRLSRYVTFDFYCKLKKNPKELQVLGDGKQTRQFCYISDAVNALTLIADKGSSAYNVAGAERVSISELAGMMVSRMAPKAKISYTGKSWPGDIKNLVADISKLKGIGFEPKTSLIKGIDHLIKWLDENPPTIGSN